MSNLPTQVQVFKYTVCKEINLSELNRPVFRNHHRLRVFFHKGTTCVTCGKVGTRLILGDGRGRNHWDVYTDDLYPLTIDHIQPKSLSGSDSLDNLQPMCSGCNKAKGNGLSHHGNGPRSKGPGSKAKNQEKATKSNVPGFARFINLGVPESNLIGKTVWRKAGKARQVKELGVVSSVEPNPHTGRMSVVLQDKEGSFFHIETLFVPEVSQSFPKGKGSVTHPCPC